MAFGDSENDVEMLEMAGIAYAMENADEKAKAVATALAPANILSDIICPNQKKKFKLSIVT
ncbi:hydrolase [Streptococcus pneumoniae]|nr:hydrolase [Streptococcus pneumoniae]